FAAEDTPDFSDAKVLSADADGYLYIDGQKIDVYLNSFDEERQLIPSGKYKLEGDIAAINCTLGIKSQENVIINLDGYKWTFEGLKHLILEGELSIYDLSEKETGKLVASSSWGVVSIQNEGAVFNLYSGTLESINTYALRCTSGTVNLYGGKIKGSKYAISYRIDSETKGLNIYDTVIESGDGYEQISCYDGAVNPENFIDVSDYTGDYLAVKFSVTEPGKHTVFEGVKNAEEAEKYSINVICNENYEVFFDKTEYDEATGEISIYAVANAFTQQPSADNNLTVDFNNTAATFQWYEYEESYIGTYTAEEFTTLFSYDFKAGDILKVSTDSEIDFVVLEVGDEYLDLRNDSKTEMIKIDADETIEIFSSIVDSENSVDIEFSVIKETALEGETGKTLQSPECGKFYLCKATVGENVYDSDIVNILPVEHDLIQVDAKAPTCTEIGWEAYEYCTACDYTTYEELPADPDAHTDADNDGVCDNGCGAEVVTLGGNVYAVDGDITNTGIHIGAFAAFDNCYKAGDGYILIKGEGNNDTVMTLYNATIDVRGTGHKDAIRVDGEDIEIRFFGENNIFADEEAYTTAIGNSRHSQTFIGADDAVLNLYGNVTVSDINIESGTVNVYGTDVNDIESVYVEGYLVISDGAVLNIISGDNGQGFNCGIIAQKEIVAEGEFNAIALTGVETDNEIIYNLTATGNAVLGADTYNPYYGMEIPEDFNVEFNFIVPEGTSVTVPEGITLNLDSMTNVDIDGELIVYGTLICTHTGGEDTCDAPAVCDICKQVYGEKLTHTDEDGDYICDHGCGYEYEKPEEPTEDTICEDCGKVHDGFFAELICFFTRIINFIKNLFA
ncbi:MAG: hypothetical protein J6Q94_02535, partial [Clostridia bacterium]|nr:hypothetical protein [Clostridia bacterium]